MTLDQLLLKLTERKILLYSRQLAQRWRCDVMEYRSHNCNKSTNCNDVGILCQCLFVRYSRFFHSNRWLMTDVGTSRLTWHHSV